MNKELTANTTLSHYRIVSKLGAGGMGEVYLAQDTSELGRTVALKILPAEVARDKDRLQRFTQEARTVSNLNHPNILTVYEFGQTDSASFIATEHIDGVTLRQHVSNRRLKLVDILDVTIQIVAALNAAHEAGVTHRDVKPENVMIRRDHIVKVLDFGLAKPMAAAQEEIDSEAGTKVFVQTEPGLVMGTVSYMSPEQSVGKDVDSRTDIWSVGVVLYEMIAGAVPFPGKDIHRQIIAIQEMDPAPLSQQVEGVPERLEEIVTKCLAKDKNERYQTAKDLLIDLRNLRRRLDVDAEIERTVAPQFRTTSGDSSHASAPGTQVKTDATSTAQIHSTSSAEYVVTGIKQHKLIIGFVVLIVVAGIAALGVYLRGRKTDDTISSIAVMPFVNESGNQDVEYLSDGMTETLISSLSQIPNLSVKARSTVFFYKGKETTPKKIGEELGVQAVLLGRVAQRGDDLRLSLELVNARTQDVLWSDTYNRKQSELVSLQSEVVREVSSKLKAKLSGADAAKVEKTYTDNAEAYQLYLKGKYFWNKRRGESLKQAAELYRQAIEKDPNYALAYSGLAETYVLFSSYDVAPADDSMPQAKAAALRALEIDDSLAEAHTALGFYLSNYEWDRDGSEKEYRRAIELKPNYATAHHWFGTDLGNVKRFDESLVELRRAQELDPLSPIIGTNLGDVLVYARRPDEAIAQYKRVLVRDPSFVYAHVALSRAYGSKGMYPEAVAESRTALELNTGSFAKGYLGLWLARSGKRDEALKLLSELREESTQNYVQGDIVALIYIGLGDKSEALTWLEKHMESRAETASVYAVATEFDGLRSEPRFKEMLKRMNLPE